MYTVSELNRTAKGLLESEFSAVWIRGEVSEFTRAPSGHLYLTLKDDAAEIGCVRFRSHSSALPQVPIAVGAIVLALGRVTLYEPRGRYQFIASVIHPVGAGALQEAFERLKRKLLEEGLFDPSHKKPLPVIPRHIGVITSPTGAAIRDIVSVISRRWPLSRVTLYPSSVQGESAPQELIAAIDAAERFSSTVEPIDVLIVGRGGGSAEDLMAFNEEQVARRIFACPIPTVSAVGHEVDFTILDFVADVRAPTPSAAAELVVPDQAEVLASLSTLAARMTRACTHALAARRLHLQANLRTSLFRIPQQKVQTLDQRLDQLITTVMTRMQAALRTRCDAFSHLSGVLRLSDPERPLQHGFSLTFVPGSTVPVSDASSLAAGDRIETRFARGRTRSLVEEVITE